jgi:hypothetical protein
MLQEIKKNHKLLQRWSEKVTETFHLDNNVQSVTFYLEPEIYDAKKEIIVLKKEPTNKDCANIDVHFDGDTIFECVSCFQSFNILSSYKDHHQNCCIRSNQSSDHQSEDNDQKNEGYKCGMCSKPFAELRDLVMHRKNHKQAHSRPKKKFMSVGNGDCTKKVVCDICGKSVDRRYLPIHQEVHSYKKQCSKCLKFIHLKRFASHVCEKNDNKKKKGKESCVSCQFCSYKTKYPQLLDGHVNKNHLKIRPYLCDVCKKGFHCRIQLSGHMKTHTMQKTEQCDLCGETFAYKKSLVWHMRRHTGETPYKCRSCEMSFLSSSRRREHELSKHSNKVFKCSICNKKYNSGNSLRSHKLECRKKFNVVNT